jgi:nitrogen fixation/metabolism regulation signal transduction histidine kinase
MLWAAGVLAAVVVCLVGLAVVVTHRIAGPALVLARVCRGVAAGSLARSRPLRKGDLLVGLADEMGGMVDALRAREEDEWERLARAAQVMVRSPEEGRAILEQVVAEKARRLGA